MNMISGIYFPDEGRIAINGRDVTIRSPKDALGLGIGMVHQHFKLVHNFTVLESIVLGRETTKMGVLKMEYSKQCSGDL
jgi:simple sugar transport system ATP-binding protein